MKHILGITTSYSSPKNYLDCELDYLRLAYAIKEIRSQGEQAQGYIVVLSPAMVEHVKQWESHYQSKDCVKVIYGSLSIGDMAKIQEEQDTIHGLASFLLGAPQGKGSNNSGINHQQGIAQRALEKAIYESEPKIKQSSDDTTFPLGILWDFYGVV